jgi:hypothetical protein
MPRILLVHGIGQQRKSAGELHDHLIGALNEGLAGLHEALRSQDFACAFYGDLFLPSGMKALGDPLYRADDVSAIEADLLDLWWREAARTDAAVAGPYETVKVRTPRTIQLALYALSRSKFFAGIAERSLIADLKQVTLYMGPLRNEIRNRIKEEITPDVQIVIGHSLGSVVAYECLAALQPPNVRLLLTLGSPLGIRNLIFDKLEPAPIHGRGVWPGSVPYWVNVAYRGDVVALEKKLAPLFGDRVQDRIAMNGSHAHDASPYLRARVTGEAIASGLRE